MNNTKYNKMTPVNGNSKALETLIDEDWVLFSYGTPVAKIHDKKLIRLWDGYSRTTMEHINWFLKSHDMEQLTKNGWEKLPVAV